MLQQRRSAAVFISWKDKSYPRSAANQTWLLPYLWLWFAGASLFDTGEVFGTLTTEELLREAVLTDPQPGGHRHQVQLEAGEQWRSALPRGEPRNLTDNHSEGIADATDDTFQRRRDGALLLIASAPELRHASQADVVDRTASRGT
jgi:hypothetical protein